MAVMVAGQFGLQNQTRDHDLNHAHTTLVGRAQPVEAGNFGMAFYRKEQL
jgi:hypothetical protein